MEELSRKNEASSDSCDEVQHLLQGRWMEGGTATAVTAPRAPSPVASPGARETEPLDKVYEHLSGCSPCRNEASALLDLDRKLEVGFRSLEDAVPELDPERLRATIARAETAFPHQTFVRRLRRGARFVLWTTFFTLALASALGLAVALHRAIRDIHF